MLAASVLMRFVPVHLVDIPTQMWIAVYCILAAGFGTFLTAFFVANVESFLPGGTPAIVFSYPLVLRDMVLFTSSGFDMIACILAVQYIHQLSHSLSVSSASSTCDVNADLV